MTSIVDILPQEALDEIVDVAALIPFHSRHILPALLATARCFQHRSRTHLYRKIEINDYGLDVKARLQQTVTTFRRNGKLARYVKEITVRYPLQDLSPEKDNHSRQLTEGHLWLTRLLVMLEGLLVVNITHHAADGRASPASVAWEDMEPNVSEGVTSLLVGRSADTLEKLEMSHIQKIPLSMISALRYLENLALGRSATVNNDGGISSNVIPGKLKYLFTSCTLPYFKHHSTLTFTGCERLTHLRLVFDQSHSYASGWKAVYSAAETLVALVIEYHLDYHRPSITACDLESFPAKTFPNVQLLKIAAYPLSPESTSTNDMIIAAPMFVCKCLRQCSFPQLQILNICTEIWLPLSQCGMFGSEGIVGQNRWWAMLADVLANTLLLPDLSTVGISVSSEIIVDVAPPRDDELDAVHRRMADLVKQEMDEVFKEAYARGGVTFGTTGVVMMTCQYERIMKDFVY